MARVYATANEWMAEYLSVDSQMDEMLEKGALLYIENDDGTTDLLATPEDGYLLPKPKLQKVTRLGGVTNG